MTNPLSAVPQELLSIPRWVRWRTVINAMFKPTKRPDCSTHDTSRFRASAEALAEGPCSDQQGVGFVLQGGARTDAGWLVALDLDACYHQGELSAWAARIVHCANSYTEISPSGTGLRVWVVVSDPTLVPRGRAKVPARGVPGSPKQPECQVFLDTGYVTVSGSHLVGTPRSLTLHPSLEWLALEVEFPAQRADTVRAPLGADAPTREAIERELERSPNWASLRDARWKDVCPNKSASDAWFELSARVVRAARYHEAAAVQFLIGLDWTAKVEESRDPAKYTREDWVVADVRRVIARSAPPEFPAVDDALLAAIPTPPPEADEHPVAQSIISTSEFLARRRAQQFLVDGVLPRVGLAQIYGLPGCGKTPFAMSLAIHVAAGRAEWFGHAIAARGKVVYMVGEDASGLGWRAEAEMIALGIKLEEIDEYLLWTTRPGQLTDPADADRWLADLARHRPAVIIIDTQSRNFGPGNENDTQDMTRYVHHLATIAERLGCLIILVHHVTKASKDTARGSSVLHGALDAAYYVERSGETTPGGESIVRMKATKAKNWADPEVLVGALVPVTVEAEVTAITLRYVTPDQLVDFDEDVPVLQTVLLGQWLAANGEYRGPMRELAAAASIELGAGGKKGVETIRAAVAEGLIEAQREGRGYVYRATAKVPDPSGE